MTEYTARHRLQEAGLAVDRGFSALNADRFGDNRDARAQSYGLLALALAVLAIAESLAATAERESEVSGHVSRDREGV